MTIAGYIVFGVISVISIAIGLGLVALQEKKTSKIITISIVIGFCVVLFGGMNWYYHNTAAGLRAFKTQDSQLSNGIERSIIVYDINGEAVESFEGKFDVTYDQERIMFDDQDGKRHVIYPGLGIVIVNEE